MARTQGFSFVSQFKDKALLFDKNGKIVKGVESRLVHWLKESADDWERTMKTKAFGPYRGKAYPGGSRGKLQARSGALRNSIKTRTRRAGLQTEVRMFTTSPYARVQEEGETIRARAGGYLRIPLPDTLTPTGANIKARYKVRKKGKRWLTSRGEPTAIVPSKKNPNNRVIIAQLGKRKKIMPLAVLTKSVTTKPRLGFFRRWRGLAKERAANRRKAIQEALKLRGS